MARKIALLIGVGDYGAGLKSLRCPENGVAAMQSVLQDPEIGGFNEVITLVNPGVGEMRSRICEVFAALTKQDLILFYFTGHGLKDMTGDFFLTTSQTQLFENGRPNAGTAIEANFLKREVGNSLAERKVVILDCCFGAAFADGFLTMSDGSVDIKTQFGGKGWCVLTASTSSRYALEQSGTPLSVYTQHLVEGLSTGAAANNGQNMITVRHWHEYVKQRVSAETPAMEPAIFSGQQGYEIAIARTKVDGIEQYRQQVKRKSQDGTIGPAAKAVLLHWQQHCRLSTARAREIEEIVLQQYWQTREKIAVYAEAFKAEKTLSYPLKQSSIQDLKDLQQLLQLTDKEISIAEALSNQPEKAVQPSPRIPKIVPLAHRPATLIQPSIAVRVTPSPDKASHQMRSILPAEDPTTLQTALPEAIQIEAIQSETIQIETIQVDRRGNKLTALKSHTDCFIEDLGNSVVLEMVKIPKGTFAMGSSSREEGAGKDEHPQRSVTLPEFWMGKYEVTQAQWQRFLSSTNPKSCKRTLEAQNRSKPIDKIFWTEAVEFCQWLSQTSKRDYRLPSQAQWEYACRANTATPFHFGETITPELANYNGNYRYGQGPKGQYRQQTTEVGSFSPNAFGLYDMHGNVWEWCLDNWHNFHQDKFEGDSVHRLSGQTKVLRGGSWFYPPTHCRSAHRLSYPFHNRTDDIGFRVVYIPLE